MGQSELVHILEQVNGWLKFAEAKNGVLITLNGAGVWGMLEFIQSASPTGFFLLYSWIFVLFMALSAILTLLSFLPVLKAEWLQPVGDQRSESNLLFFGHIAEHTPEELLEALDISTREDLNSINRDYAEQAIINSQIALRKYNLFHLSLWLTLSGITTPVLSLITWYATRRNS